MSFSVSFPVKTGGSTIFFSLVVTVIFVIAGSGGIVPVGFTIVGPGVALGVEAIVPIALGFVVGLVIVLDQMMNLFDGGLIVDGLVIVLVF